MKVSEAELHRQLFPIFRAMERESYLEELLVQRRIEAIAQRGDRAAMPVVTGHPLFDRDRRTIIAIDVRCPWCGCRHTHAAGPRHYMGDGPRYSHCTARAHINSGYIIREQRAAELRRA